MRGLRVTLSAAAVLAAISMWLPSGTAAAEPADTAPPGANDWNCRPSVAHPNPVVLVHGTGANMSWNWPRISPLLASRGWCVFALTYGRDPRAPAPFDQMGGVLPMEQSAAELATFVDRVLAATGATKVDVVGHSQGSLMPDYYVKYLGGTSKVERYVGMTPLWDGTNFLGAGFLYALGLPSGGSRQLADFIARFCGSCPQFVHGSDFLQHLNSGGAAVPGVSYTMLMTRYDELVVPYTSGFLNGANNIVVQRGCPLDFAEHAAMAFDPVVEQHVVNALDPAHARPVKCSLVLPVLGGGG
jgi:triacylglycerol lipase